MTRRLPLAEPRDVVRALERAGWVNVPQVGSHVQMRKKGNPRVISVPQHDRELKRGILSGIRKDADISVDEFIELLRS